MVEGKGPKSKSSSEAWNTTDISQTKKDFSDKPLTSKRLIASWKELREIVAKQWLGIRRLVEKEPSRSKEHVVCIPSSPSIEETVTRIERTTIGRVVSRIELVDTIQHVRSQSTIVEDEVTDKLIESLIFRQPGMSIIEKCLAEDGSFIELKIHQLR